MKRLTKINLIWVLAIALAIGNLNDAMAGKKMKITLKNNSAADANDVHLTAENGKTFISAHAPGFTPADKAPAGGSHTLDWPSSDNDTPIPHPGSIVIDVELLEDFGDVKKDSCSLTYNGVTLSTSTSQQNVDAFRTGANTGNIIFQNLDLTQSWVVLNFQLFVDNPTNPLSGTGSPFNPSGSPAAIPPSFTIPPGGTQTFPYSFTNPSYYVGAHYFTAPSSNIGDMYEGAISNLQSANGPTSSSIPTLPQWGLIALFVLMVSVGMFFVRRRIV